MRNPAFHLWQKETLVKYAEEAFVKINQQNDEIVQLRADLKIAQDAWREELLRKSSIT